MGQIQLNFPTNIPVPQCQQRLNRLASWLRREANITTTWHGNRAYMKGKYLVVDIQAVVIFAPGMVTVAAEEPAPLFRGKAESFLKEKFALYFNPNVQLERLPA